MNYNYQSMDSPIGSLAFVEKDGNLHAVMFQKQWPNIKEQFKDLVEAETPVLKETKHQLSEYFQGKRRFFDLPIQLTGTVFQQRVWSWLATIPFGETRSYKEQAAGIDAPQAVRAVGRTNGLNPLCVVLPCHRVIGANGSLTGYGGGLETKKFLLELEARAVGKSTPADWNDVPLRKSQPEMALKA